MEPTELAGIAGEGVGEAVAGSLGARKNVQRVPFDEIANK
jgi:hypothetical protein